MPYERTVDHLAARLRALLDAGELDIPDPAIGATAKRWSALSEWGRRDLSLARLAEGHTDAVSILREAGRSPEPGALYGVWAARSGGTGAELHGSVPIVSVLNRSVLSGTVRYCSGAHFLDRALVAAMTEDRTIVLVDVDLTDSRVKRKDDSWKPVGMAATDSEDVVFDQLPVEPEALVGPPDFYLERPGFWWGGAGVAAVWWGGGDGLVDRVSRGLRENGADEHQLAHIGALHAGSSAARALLAETAHAIDADPGADARLPVWTLRSAVEAFARDVVDRVPRITGATPLSRDGELACALTDLQLYIRQHHAERDLAALGGLTLERAGA